MNTFDQQEYNKFIIKHKVLGFFEQPITLKSGRISPWYVNCRTLLDTVGVIDDISEYVLAYVKEKTLSADYFYGVPEGATKLAVVLNYKKGKQEKNAHQALVIGRGKPKVHGAPVNKYFIGPVNPGDRVIAIEDVTTTGGSLIDTINHLKESQVVVQAAVGLVNRMEKRDDGKSVEQVINEMDVPYYAMSSAITLLPMARDASETAESVLVEVEKYFEKYGIEPLTLT